MECLGRPAILFIGAMGEIAIWDMTLSHCSVHPHQRMCAKSLFHMVPGSDNMTSQTGEIKIEKVGLPFTYLYWFY